ncbi:hypothetical protein BY458DRAFT_489227, partial [Sporodiniella umbellata]
GVSLWSSTQVNKTLANERYKLSSTLTKADDVEVTKKLQIWMAEEEGRENLNTSYKITKDDDNDYSNERSDNTSDENLVYILDKYKKKNTLSIRQGLLGLALFGINEVENNNAKCILLVQIIGKMQETHTWRWTCFQNFKNQNPIVYAKFAWFCTET